MGAKTRTKNGLLGEIARLEKANRRAKKQIAEMRDALLLCDPDGRRAALITAPEDPAVLALCEQWGFGAVMDSAARQWRKRDPLGAHTTGPAAASVMLALGRKLPAAAAHPTEEAANE